MLCSLTPFFCKMRLRLHFTTASQSVLGAISYHPNAQQTFFWKVQMRSIHRYNSTIAMTYVPFRWGCVFFLEYLKKHEPHTDFHSLEDNTFCWIGHGFHVTAASQAVLKTLWVIWEGCQSATVAPLSFHLQGQFLSNRNSTHTAFFQGNPLTCNYYSHSRYFIPDREALCLRPHRICFNGLGFAPLILKRISIPFS